MAVLDKLYDFCSETKIIVVGGVCLAASLILMLAGFHHIPADPALAAVLLCGYPLLYDAIWIIYNRKGIYKISSPMLISIAMVASIFIGHYFAAGQVAFIMAVGGLLQDKTLEKANKGIKNLISLAPETGRLITDGAEELVPVAQINVGDVLRVLPGEAVPVDGEILSGDTSVDQSVISGESLPIDKTAGDSVYCGTINRFGAIDIKATKVGEDSSLNKLIRLVEEAEENKAPLQRIIDKWAVYLVPATLVIAAATFIITGDITRAVTVAVVFCPCALALATPTSIIAAIGQAAKYGVIVKSGEALEKMGKADMVVFDKTGTLTRGDLTVSDTAAFGGLGEDGFLSLIASAEAYSEHPLGKAIAAYAKERGVPLMDIDNFKMTPGRGVGADIGGKRLLAGSAAFLADNNVTETEEAASLAKKFRSQGKAVILVAYGGVCAGAVALSDTLRASARDMVGALAAAGTLTALLTGDNQQTADYFAAQAGIRAVYAELLPEDKVARIRAMQEAGHAVCMIGDGVNDAPALKAADVGVAMGGMGSDISVEAADVALMSDDISRIPYLKRLSDATVRLIFINVTVSIIFNIAAITLATMGYLNPITGALAHNAGSVAVILNAAMLYDRKF